MTRSRSIFEGYDIQNRLIGELGIETSIDLEAAIAAALLAEELVDHALPGKVMHGGSLEGKRSLPRSIAA